MLREYITSMTEHQDNKQLVSAVKQLRSKIISGTPDETAELFIASYIRYGGSFLSRVKTEKVLFGINSIGRGNSIYKGLHKRLVAAVEKREISMDEAKRITRFANEHRVINTPKIHIREYLEDNQCWQIERTTALFGLVAEIEEQSRHQATQETDSRLSPIIQSQAQHSGLEILREAGKLALREVLQRNPRERKSQVANCRWNEILNLADRWLAIQLVEDGYAYFDWTLFIDKAEDFDLVVCRPEFKVEGVLHFADYRAVAFDLAAIQKAQSKLVLSDSKVSAQVLDQVYKEGSIDNQLFLQKMPPDIETHVKIMRTGLRQAVEESHISVLKGSEEYGVKVLPVLQTIKCLYRLSTLRSLALNALSEQRPLRHEDLILVLPLKQLLKYVQEFGEIDSNQVDWAFRLLTFSPDEGEVKAYDPYLKPMISINGDQVLILETYLNNSRFMRNTLKLLTESHEITLTACGTALENRLKEILKAKKFITNENGPVKIVGPDGRVITDLDLLAYRDGILVLGQAKAVIPPGNRYEIYRMLQTLEDAAEQLSSCMANLGANQDIIKNSIQDKLESESFEVKRVLPYILTNDITLTGHQIKGFQILDPIVLEDAMKEVASKNEISEISLDKFILQLESLSTTVNLYSDRVTYAEVNLGGTMFLTPVIVLAPVKSPIN